MPGYTQADMPLRIDTHLDEDVLLIQGFSGVEAVSTPFSFEVDLLSEDPEIAAEDMLRTGAVITMDLADGSQRTIHGLIRRFVQRGQRDDLVSYRCELVPWLRFLTLSRECRIFQDLNVLEIVEKVFTDQGYSDFELRCVRNYPTWEYRVQYRESHLDFVSRLLEEEGIFYFFEHTDSGHTLVLADDNSAFKPCPGPTEARMRPEAHQDEDVVTGLDREHAAFVGKVTLTDYDYLQPTFKLRTEISGQGKEEVYDYHPRRYSDLDEGDRYARLMLEHEEVGRQVVHGEGTCRHFQAGTTFDLKEHYRRDANQTYILTRVEHRAQAGDYRAHRSTEVDHRNRFVGIPTSVPYRPPRRTRKPVLLSSQTAVVVGKKGEDITVDKYGRIKVQFHWDREGQEDDGSSCWVRVSQNWAGGQWGGMFVPHVGQEVIVSFLEGDPDRPIVTGRVYNDKNMAPLPLPGNQTKSIIRDHGGNEIVMEGKSGSQQIRLYSPEQETKIVLGAPNSGNIHLETLGRWVAAVTGDKFETVDGETKITRRGAVKTEMKGTFNKITAGVETSQNLSAKSTTTAALEHGTFAGGKVETFHGFKRATTHGYVKEVTRGKKKSVVHAVEEKHVMGKAKKQADGPQSMSSDVEITLTVGGAQILISDDQITMGANKIVLHGTDFVEIKSGGNIKLTPSGKVDVPAGNVNDKHLKTGKG